MSATPGPDAVGVTGRWQITTETALYVVDMDARTCVRVPDAGLGTVDGLSPAVVSAKRLDHQPIPLVSLIRAELGEPLLLVLDLRGDGVKTVRQSTVVRDIRSLAGP